MKWKYVTKFLCLFLGMAALTIVVISPIGCNKNGDDVNITISLTDTAYSALNNQAGGEAYLSTDGVSIVVVRIAGGAANPFVALSSACTRDQCTVAYKPSLGGLQCPCCLSIFSTTGAVASGLATSPLTSYYVIINGNNLTITSSVPCTTPINRITNAITASTATFVWSPITGASNYNIQYREVGASSWISKSTSSSSLTVAGLASGTEYEWQVQTNCSGGGSSYSGTIDFTTNK